MCGDYMGVYSREHKGRGLPMGFTEHMHQLDGLHPQPHFISLHKILLPLIQQWFKICGLHSTSVTSPVYENHHEMPFLNEGNPNEFNLIKANKIKLSNRHQTKFLPYRSFNIKQLPLLSIAGQTKINISVCSTL